MKTEEEIWTQFDLSEKDLEIDNTTIFSLEREIKNYPKLVDNFGRAYAQAIAQESRAKLRFEITQARLIKEETKKTGKDSAYNIRELRKSILPMEKDYQDAMNEWIDSTELVNIYKGLYFSIVYKNTRIQELFQIEMRRIIGDNKRGMTSKQIDKMLNTDLDNYNDNE